MELSNSNAFAACQVKKVFQTVCLREPETDGDHIEVGQIITNFGNSGFQMKRVFADTAEYCMGQ